MSTGRGAKVGNALWLEIESESGRGWVNSFFLTEEKTAEEFVRALDQLRNVLDRFVELTATLGDLSPLMSQRGLHVIHIDPMRRFRPSELPTLLADTRLQRWGNHGCSAEECPDVGWRTFKEAVADSFVSAYDDPDLQITVDEVGGFQGCGRTEFCNFHFLAIHDPGDNPEHGGHDWVTWFVYFDSEDEGWRMVGMSIDNHAP